MHFLLGIHGKAKSGKDTAANYLVKNHGFIRNAFADPLKLAAQQMFFLTDAQTWSEELKDIELPYWGMSPRKMFQLLGTEGGRNVFGGDIWLKRWQFHYEQFAPFANYVTPDVRFDNEADLIRERGGIILHIQSERSSILTKEAQGHASEQGICMTVNDIIIENSGSFEALYMNLNSLMEALTHGE